MITKSTETCSTTTYWKVLKTIRQPSMEILRYDSRRIKLRVHGQREIA
ncbi:hypothetical protein EVA_10322 [gut metagenome]|uniref:Uncharacterized protein n=1 Tax=gut metagenome TaxID=749906 RepID=J9G314_9ZZZZ